MTLLNTIKNKIMHAFHSTNVAAEGSAIEDKVEKKLSRFESCVQKEPHRDVYQHATPALAYRVRKFEKHYRLYLNEHEESRRRLEQVQGKLGISARHDHRQFLVPSDNTPYWLRAPSRIELRCADTQLPEEADVVIVGAGLTGASTAYHMARLKEELYAATITGPFLTSPRGGLEKALAAMRARVGKSVLWPAWERGLRAAWVLKDAQKSFFETSIPQLIEEACIKGPSIVVLEKDRPASGASGKNGGNIEIIPENYFCDLYEGLEVERLKSLREMQASHCVKRTREVSLADTDLKKEARRHAEAVLHFAHHNRDTLRATVERENIACDFSPTGWIKTTEDADEALSLQRDHEIVRDLKIDSQMWRPDEIHRVFDINATHVGRFSPSDGTYHPWKFVEGVFDKALDKHVNLCLHTEVMPIQPGSVDDGLQEVVTTRGTVRARVVVLATEGFTRKVLPEFSEIETYRSQIQVTEHAPDKSKGKLVTGNKGDKYWNQPRGGAHKKCAPLLMGGDADRPIRSIGSGGDTDAPTDDPDNVPIWKSTHDLLLKYRHNDFPELDDMPLSAEWAGPMGFTRDRLPVVGALRENIYMCAGFNGYGGSFTVAAGDVAAQEILTGSTPAWFQGDVFTPNRFS